MVNGRWVTVPGKGRRFVTDAGEYRYGDPNAPLAPLAKNVKNFFEQLTTSRISPDKLRSLAAPGLSSLIAAPARAAEFTGPPVPARLANAPTAPALPSPTVSQSAGERAYTAEKERVQQLTAQDPLLKKYQVAELTKQYNAAKGDERERIGLQIWAQTNSELAANLRPGQTGYAEVRQTPGMMMSVPNFRSAAESVLPLGAAATSLAGPPVFAQPENALEETLSPGMLGSAYSGGIQFPESLIPAGIGQESPAQNFQPTSSAAFDPAAINLDQTTRKLLKQAYNRGLK